MAIIMITHDLGVVAELCDEVIVMYAGGICEQGTADEIFYNPPSRVHQGPPPLHPDCRHRRDESSSSITGTAHRPSEHARRLRLRAPVRRGNENLYAPAVSADGDQRPAPGRMLDECQARRGERLHYPGPKCRRGQRR